MFASVFFFCSDGLLTPIDDLDKHKRLEAFKALRLKKGIMPNSSLLNCLIWKRLDGGNILGYVL